MNEQAKKINRVMKCCKIVKIISKVIQITLMVGAGLCLIGVLLMAFTPADKLIEENKNGNLTMNYKVNETVTFKIADIGSDDFEFVRPESSIDSLNQALKNADDPTLFKFLSISYIGIGLIALSVASVIMLFINQTFATIIKDQTPFSKNVLKKLKITFILLTIISFVTLGIGITILVGFCCFALYTIIDYGSVLQIESDETL